MSFTAQRPIANDRLLQSLADARSIEAIDETLELLVTDEGAQQNAEKLLSGWGHHGNWYDLGVVIFLVEHWPSAYGHQTVEAKPLIPIVQERIREQPELNRQLYWYLQWRYGPFDFHRICHDLTYGPTFDVVVGGEEFIPLMRVSSAMNDWHTLDCARWEDLGISMHIAQLQFLSKRPFLRFDEELGHYKVDEEAMREGRYLKPEEQQATKRRTPLPNWDHPIVPEVPADPYETSE